MHAQRRLVIHQGAALPAERGEAVKEPLPGNPDRYFVRAVTIDGRAVGDRTAERGFCRGASEAVGATARADGPENLHDLRATLDAPLPVPGLIAGPSRVPKKRSGAARTRLVRVRTHGSFIPPVPGRRLFAQRSGHLLSAQNVSRGSGQHALRWIPALERREKAELPPPPPRQEHPPNKCLR